MGFPLCSVAFWNSFLSRHVRHTFEQPCSSLWWGRMIKQSLDLFDLSPNRSKDFLEVLQKWPKPQNELKCLQILKTILLLFGSLALTTKKSHLETLKCQMTRDYIHLLFTVYWPNLWLKSSQCSLLFTRPALSLCSADCDSLEIAHWNRMNSPVHPLIQ